MAPGKSVPSFRDKASIEALHDSLLFGPVLVGPSTPSVTYLGTVVVFGVVSPMPLRGFPPGAVRIRVRSGRAVEVIVRGKTSCRSFTVREVDECWEPAFEIAANHRPTQP